MFLYTVNYLEKKIIKLSLRLLLPLAFTSGCLSFKNPAVVSQHIWTPFSTVPLFSFGNIMKEPSAMFIREGSRIFRGKKSKLKCIKWSLNSMLRPTVLHDEISCCTISLEFSSLSLSLSLSPPPRYPWKVAAYVFKCHPRSFLCTI